MKQYNEVDLAKFAADAIVLILFFVALTVIVGFCCMLYVLLWLMGIV